MLDKAVLGRPGRPRLSKVGRTATIVITVTPEHKEWLDTQIGGRSAVIRRAIEMYMGKTRTTRAR